MLRSRTDGDLKSFINQPQAWNKYSYTINDPLNYFDPNGERWFVKEGEFPVWVNPNQDGSYTSAGEGWTAFVTGTGINSVLRYFNDKGTIEFDFTEKKDGSPGFSALSTGKVDDASDEVIEAALAANGFYRTFQLAQAVWNGVPASTDHSIESVEDIFNDPTVLNGKTVEDVAPKIRGTPGWEEEGMRHSKINPGGGWIFREYTEGKQETGRMIQFSPGRWPSRPNSILESQQW
ncbi:MAG TPA: hypothetical protein VEZ90_18925 [Blastocatellia bacterium]|nr:hypothetical protein [Blastocatellia bacterium]